MSSMPVRLAASISITSTWRSPAMAVQCSQVPQADAVEGAGEDARGRRLAHAAHAGEDVGLGDAPGRDRVAEGTDRGLLADQVGEAGRAVLAGEHPVGRRLGGLLGAGALRVLGQVRHESAAGSSVSPRGPV
jgi:hypothetical protein